VRTKDEELYVHTRARSRIVRERVQLGATLRAVTAAVNMAGTAAAASAPDRYGTLSLPFFLPGTTLLNFILFPRTVENV
jgi:hypothetical protein